MLKQFTQDQNTDITKRLWFILNCLSPKFTLKLGEFNYFIYFFPLTLINMKKTSTPLLSMQKVQVTEQIWAIVAQWQWGIWGHHLQSQKKTRYEMVHKSREVSILY